MSACGVCESKSIAVQVGGVNFCEPCHDNLTFKSIGPQFGWAKGLSKDEVKQTHATVKAAFEEAAGGASLNEIVHYLRYDKGDEPAASMLEHALVRGKPISGEDRSKEMKSQILARLRSMTHYASGRHMELAELRARGEIPPPRARAPKRRPEPRFEEGEDVEEMEEGRLAPPVRAPSSAAADAAVASAAAREEEMEAVRAARLAAEARALAEGEQREAAARASAARARLQEEARRLAQEQEEAQRAARLAEQAREVARIERQEAEEARRREEEVVRQAEIVRQQEEARRAQQAEEARRREEEVVARQAEIVRQQEEARRAQEEERRRRREEAARAAEKAARERPGRQRRAPQRLVEQ